MVQGLDRARRALSAKTLALSRNMGGVWRLEFGDWGFGLGLGFVCLAFVCELLCFFFPACVFYFWAMSLAFVFLWDDLHALRVLLCTNLSFLLCEAFDMSPELVANQSLLLEHGLHRRPHALFALLDVLHHLLLLEEHLQCRVLL